MFSWGGWGFGGIPLVVFVRGGVLVVVLVLFVFGRGVWGGCVFSFGVGGGGGGGGWGVAGQMVHGHRR